MQLRNWLGLYKTFASRINWARRARRYVNRRIERNQPGYVTPASDRQIGPSRWFSNPQMRRALQKQTYDVLPRQLETLEERTLLVATVFVNDNWNLVTDNGAIGVIDAGDVVDDANDAGGPTGTFTLDDGTGTIGNAFGTVATGAATGSVAAADTIGDAINAVDSGGTVNVLAGTFIQSGQMNVDQSVTIIGAGRDQTIIQSGGSVTGKEQRTIQINAADVTIQNLTLGGWENAPSDANVGFGYLAWLNADNATFDNVRFDADDNRVAIYVGQFDGLTVQDSRFTGTYFRAGIRGAGENMLITRNSFEESHYWYSPIYFEYGGDTSGEISYNYFANRVGVNNQIYGNFKSDGTGLWAITNFQPDTTTADGLTIAHNTFHFQDSDLVNGLGNQPIPVGV